jgi:hypothetical protein
VKAGVWHDAPQMLEETLMNSVLRANRGVSLNKKFSAVWMAASKKRLKITLFEKLYVTNLYSRDYRRFEE